MAFAGNWCDIAGSSVRKKKITLGHRSASTKQMNEYNTWSRLSTTPFSFVSWVSGAVCMKYIRAAYKLARTLCRPPPDRRTVSISPFRMATDAPTGREEPDCCRDLLPPKLSGIEMGVVAEFKEMVHCRRCAMRHKMTPDTGDVSSANALSSAIYKSWKSPEKRKGKTKWSSFTNEVYLVMPDRTDSTVRADQEYFLTINSTCFATYPRKSCLCNEFKLS